MDDIKIVTRKLDKLYYKGKPISVKDVMKMCEDNLVMEYRDDEETERVKKFLSTDKGT